MSLLPYKICKTNLRYFYHLASLKWLKQVCYWDLHVQLEQPFENKSFLVTAAFFLYLEGYQKKNPNSKQQQQQKLFRSLTPNVLHHTTPHKLCRFEMKDMHGLQCFSSAESDGSESLLFILCLKQDTFFLRFNFQKRIQPFFVQL